jgi:hypothetical protein
MVTDDPWYWEVNDIVAEICNSSALFQAASCKVEDIPDTAHLEDQFREREVTGRTLLTAYDSDTLRQELQVQDVDKRRALISVIALLRQHSEAYKQSVATVGVQALDLNREPSQHPRVPSFQAATNDADGGNRRRVPFTTVPLPANPVRADTALAVAANITVDSSGQWDHLQRWAQADTPDEVIDFTQPDDEERLFGAETVEGDRQDPMDDGEEIDDIQEAYQVQDVQRRSKLTRDQILDIVNQCIEDYAEAWTPNKGVLKEDEVDYDPLRMWQDAEACGQRQLLVDKYETDLAYYNQRLHKLGDRIMDGPGNNVKEIQLQCGLLEITVYSMELSRWLLSIYALKAEDDSDDEEQLHDRSPSVEPFAARYQPHIEHVNLSQRHAEIIDLGSTPASSQGEDDRMLIDSPYPHEAHLHQPRTAFSGRFQTPDSLVIESVEHPVEHLAETPAEPYGTDRTAPLWPQVLLDDEPENASIGAVRRWNWDDLIDTQDRKRIVSKVLNAMKRDDREMIRSRLSTVDKADIVREISACIAMLARRETKMQDVLPRDMSKILTFSRLFLSWWLCENYFRAEPSQWHLEGLREHLEQGSPDPGTFCDYLNKVMTTTFSPEALRNPERPSQAEIIDISSDDDEPAATQRNGATQRPRHPWRQSPIVLD